MLACPICKKEAFTQHGSDMYCDGGHIFSVHNAITCTCPHTNRAAGSSIYIAMPDCPVHSPHGRKEGE